jgi:hypothetical protein
MNDAEKWLEAAAGIEQDLEYCKNDLSEDDIRELLLAMAVTGRSVLHPTVAVREQEPDRDGHAPRLQVNMLARC